MQRYFTPEMDPIEIYIFEDIEKAKVQQDKKLAASGQLPKEPVYNNELLRVAGVCALGALCLKRKSLPFHISKELISQGALIGSILSGLGFAFLKSSRLAVKPRVVW